jgi:hypothetical protein
VLGYDATCELSAWLAGQCNSSYLMCECAHGSRTSLSDLWQDDAIHGSQLLQALLAGPAAQHIGPHIPGV